MKITVEHYNEKVSIETDHDDVTFDEFVILIERLSYCIGYHHDVIQERFNEEV